MGSEAEKTIARGVCPHDCPDTCAMPETAEPGRAIYPTPGDDRDA